jgi:hypothetical protein
VADLEERYCADPDCRAMFLAGPGGDRRSMARFCSDECTRRFHNANRGNRARGGRGGKRAATAELIRRHQAEYDQIRAEAAR